MNQRDCRWARAWQFGQRLCAHLPPLSVVHDAMLGRGGVVGLVGVLVLSGRVSAPTQQHAAERR